MVAVIVTNVFGDRWTYIDLSAFTWILLALVVQGTLWTQSSANAPEPAPAAQSVATVVDRIRVRMRGLTSGKFRGLR
jgi:hypothetical protein